MSCDCDLDSDKVNILMAGAATYSGVTTEAPEINCGELEMEKKWAEIVTKLTFA